MKSLGIIGGGLFGCTAAIISKQMKVYDSVTIYESEDDILCGASGHNQLRFHKGYHYPRSPETAFQCLDGFEAADYAFEKLYGDALLKDGETLYAIPREGSKVNAEEFEEFCRLVDLPLHECLSDLVDMEKIQRSWLVSEPRIDVIRLKTAIYRWIKRTGVKLKLETSIEAFTERPHKARGFSRAGVFDKEEYYEHDDWIIATYDRIDDLIPNSRFFKQQIVEKQLIWIDYPIDKVGVVILDGEFGCVDPYANSGLHLMSHVTESILKQQEVQTCMKAPRYISHNLNGNFIKAKISTYEKVLKANREFMPFLEHAHYVGSWYTRRSVHAMVEDTDKRPTEVDLVEPHIIKIFSGKMPTCVTAVIRALSLLKNVPEEHRDAR